MSKKETDATRRDFLKLATTAAPLAATAVVSSGAAAQAAAEPDFSSDKMQDTAHTRAYFESLRF